MKVSQDLWKLERTAYGSQCLALAAVPKETFTSHKAALKYIRQNKGLKHCIAVPIPSFKEE